MNETQQLQMEIDRLLRIIGRKESELDRAMMEIQRMRGSIISGLWPLVKDEPEAKGNNDAIDVTVKVITRLKSSQQSPISDLKPERNGRVN